VKTPTRVATLSCISAGVLSHNTHRAASRRQDSNQIASYLDHFIGHYYVTDELAPNKTRAIDTISEGSKLNVICKYFITV